MLDDDSGEPNAYELMTSRARAPPEGPQCALRRARPVAIATSDRASAQARVAPAALHGDLRQHGNTAGSAIGSRTQQGWEASTQSERVEVVAAQVVRALSERGRLAFRCRLPSSPPYERAGVHLKRPADSAGRESSRARVRPGCRRRRPSRPTRPLPIETMSVTRTSVRPSPERARARLSPGGPFHCLCRAARLSLGPAARVDWPRLARAASRIPADRAAGRVRDDGGVLQQ